MNRGRDNDKQKKDVQSSERSDEVESIRKLLSSPEIGAALLRAGKAYGSALNPKKEPRPERN